MASTSKNSRLQVIAAVDLAFCTDKNYADSSVELKPKTVPSTRDPECLFTFEAKVTHGNVEIIVRNTNTECGVLFVDCDKTSYDFYSCYWGDMTLHPRGSRSTSALAHMTGASYKLSYNIHCSNGLRYLHFRVRVYAAVASSAVSRALQRARLDGGSPPCDVVLCAGGTELRAHRVLLAAVSPVFARMLSGGGHFQEDLKGRVELRDTSSTALEKLVEFVYTDTVEDWAGLELELLALADKYMVPPLKADCELQLWLADGPRALTLLREADGCPLVDAKLRRRWIRTVAWELSAVVETPEWAAFQEAEPRMAEVMMECCASRMSAGKWLD